MIEDVIVKEYKIYGRETDTIAQEEKALLNDGYRVKLYYAAENIGSVLLEAVKEQQEEPSEERRGKEIPEKEPPAVKQEKEQPDPAAKKTARSNRKKEKETSTG